MNYKTPGVYVEEQSSASQPIIGVSTTTPVFIGFYPKHLQLSERIEVEITVDPLDYTSVDKVTPNVYQHVLNNAQGTIDDGIFEWKILEGKKFIKNVNIVQKNTEWFCNLELIKTATIAQAATGQFDSQTSQTENKPKKEKIIVELIYLQYVKNDDTNNTIEVKQCKNFTDFQAQFGDFIIHPEKKFLAHAVSGFYQNGGTQCYVCSAEKINNTSNNLIAPGLNEQQDIDRLLTDLEKDKYGDISLVIPIGANQYQRNKITAHCNKMKDRFAILHFERNVLVDEATIETLLNDCKDKAAVYHPWVRVFDSAKNSEIDVPPSGHVAGIYARVDARQGVQKAPANEVVVGATGVSIGITREEQDKFNPIGINYIRVMNGQIKVWGARTLSNNDINDRYINVVRSFMFLSESIEKGTEWAVFQSNTPALRQQIARNITDFLMTQWRAGMLFGETQQDAFRVQCDAETNSNANQGELKAVVQVALVRPAEFIVIQISHKQAS